MRMMELSYLAAGVFLPLFPLSMLFNVLFDRLHNVAARVALLLVWPQLGIGLLRFTDASLPDWLIGWAVFTSALYALRAVVLREVGLWSSFIATSAWTLLWIPAQQGVEIARLQYYALGFSIPLLLLTMLADGLTRRFGAAYTGLYGGLAQTIPRFSGVLVMVILAIIATPLFPSFFTMLATVVQVMPAAPALAVGLVLIWLLWSWAGARLLQGLIVGPADERAIPDLSLSATWIFALALAGLIVAGIYLAGQWL